MLLKRVPLNLIQAFRGFAAVVVALHHIAGANFKYFKITLFNGFFLSGWSGVDFFFVLSGFIITYVHLNDVINRKNLMNFIFKRFVRIYPTYWIIATIALMVFLKLGKYSLQTDYVYIIKCLLLVQYGTGLFLAVAWTLVYEVFFYLIFGLCIVLGFKYSKFIIIIWFFLTLLLNLLDSDFTKQIAFNNFILEFLMGCFIAYIFLKWNAQLSPYRTLIFRCGLLLFMATWMISWLTHFASITALESRISYGLASSAIILGSALIDSFKAIKVNKALLLLGDSSYALYLIHSLCLAIIFGYSKNHFHTYKAHTEFYYLLFTVTLAISLLTSTLFHLFMEKNLLKRFYNLSFTRILQR
jgi:exopolysaccharide production protein ExoZ